MRGQERPLLTTLALLVVQLALDATIVSRRTGHALAEQIAQSELDEARRALLEERTRIAREMHDVVAHHMSLIAVQAETAPYRLDDLSESCEGRVRRAERHRARGAERRPPAARRPPQRRPRRARAPAEARRRRDAGRGVATRRGQRRPLHACERRRERSPMRSGSAPTASSRRRSRTPAGTLPERGCRSWSSATRTFSGSTSSTGRRRRATR